MFVITIGQIEIYKDAFGKEHYELNVRMPTKTFVIKISFLGVHTTFKIYRIN